MVADTGRPSVPCRGFSAGCAKRALSRYPFEARAGSDKTPQFGPTSANFGRVCPGFGQICPTLAELGQCRPNLGRIWAPGATFRQLRGKLRTASELAGFVVGNLPGCVGPPTITTLSVLEMARMANSGRVTGGRPLPGNTRPISIEIDQLGLMSARPTWDQIGQFPLDPARERPNADRTRPKSIRSCDQIWLGIGRSQPDFDQMWPDLDRNRRRFAKFGPEPTKLGLESTKIGPTSVKLGPSLTQQLTKFGRDWPANDQFWPANDQSWPHFGQMWATREAQRSLSWIVD